MSSDHTLSKSQQSIVHIGAPKCGSSSIQQILSKEPKFSGRGRQTYEYVCVGRGNKLLSGARLRALAQMSPLGYSNSRSLTHIEDATDALETVIAPIHDRLKAGITPVLSAEGWLHHPDVFEKSEFFSKLGANAHVIIFVRPPVLWLNSAWWQWGVWTGTPLDAFVRTRLPKANWIPFLEKWGRIPGVSKVTVRLLSGDVRQEFFDLLDVPFEPTKVINTGVPAEFLQFLLRNRQLRPGVHSPDVEFLLERLLPADQGRTPWGLKPGHVEWILENTRSLCDELPDHLNTKERAIFQKDRRWRDVDAFSDRSYEPAGRPQSVQELAEMHALLQSSLPKALRAGKQETQQLQLAQTDVAHADHMITTALRRLQMVDRSRRFAALPRALWPA